MNSTYNYALGLIADSGGNVTENKIRIKIEEPFTSEAEVSFPDLVFDEKLSVFEKNNWKFTGKWQVYKVLSGRENIPREQSMFAEKSGDELVLNFSGTGISLEGNWYRDGGKADIYVDGNFHRTIDTYYDFANQQHTESIWHILNLKPGDHTVKMTVKGEKRPESEGTRVYITSATIFKTAPKQSENFKFSFE